MITKLGKHIFFAILLSGISYVSFAQRPRMQGGMPPDYSRQRPNGRPYNPPQRLKPIQKIKEDYISKQLALPPGPTIKFEELYRRYLQETRAVMILKHINNSDAQANGTEQVNKDMAYERELVNIKQRYTNEFLKIMPPEKVSIIFKSEHQFNEEVLRQLKEQNKNRATAAPAN